MKNLLCILMMLLVGQIIAQAPQAFNYQGIARNGNGDPLITTTVTLRITIKEGGTPGLEVYRELHHVTTNKLGLFTLEIGRGTNSVGELSDVQWQAGAHYIQTEIDPSGGQNFTNLGTAQLLSVPYALYAGNSNSSSQWNENVNGIDFADGNVGIGTNTPNHKLAIRDDVDDIDGIDGRVLISLENTSTSDRSFAGLQLNAGTSPSSTSLQHIASSYNFDGNKYPDFGQLTTNGRGLILRSDRNDSSIKFLAGNVNGNIIQERMRITGSGLVGIGTETPAYKLSIQDDVDDNDGRNLLSLNNTSTSNRSLAGIRINAGSGTFETRMEHVATSYDFDGDKYTGFGQFLSTGNGIILRATRNDGVIKFLAGNINTNIAQERMRITGTGFIGIGTEDPASKLQVTGGDVFIENINSGVIMKSPDGNCWRVTIQNDGSMKTSSILCPN